MTHRSWSNRHTGSGLPGWLIELGSPLCANSVVRCSGNGRKGPIGDLRRGPPVREAWTNRGRALRKLGEPNGGQDCGSHQPAAIPLSVLHGGSPMSRDPLLVFRAAYRSDTRARQATFGRLRIPLVISVCRSSEGAHGCQMQILRGYPGCGNAARGCAIAIGRVLYHLCLEVA